MPPESPDGKATVADCTGTALDLVDNGLSSSARGLPPNLARVTVRQGGLHLLFGTALAVAAVLRTWADLSGESVASLAGRQLR